MDAASEITFNVVTVEGAKLSLSAGDTLVLTMPQHPTRAQVEQITAYATKSLPEGVKVLVLGGGITVAAEVKA